MEVNRYYVKHSSGPWKKHKYIKKIGDGADAIYQYASDAVTEGANAVYQRAADAVGVNERDAYKKAKGLQDKAYKRYKDYSDDHKTIAQDYSDYERQGGAGYQQRRSKDAKDHEIYKKNHKEYQESVRFTNEYANAYHDGYKQASDYTKKMREAYYKTPLGKLHKARNRGKNIVNKLLYG